MKSEKIEPDIWGYITCSKPPTLCIFCGHELKDGLGFKATEKSRWTYLKPGEAAHIECYIDNGIKFGIEKCMEKEHGH